MDGEIRNAKNLSTLANAATRRQVLIAGAGAFGCLTAGLAKAWAGTTDEISHTCEAIHQEVVFKVSRKRVYEALTDAKQFNKVVMLSAAMQSGMAPGSTPVEISAEVGGAFSAFGGYVTGRQVELVPNERIVQAWRAGGWDPGQYSIARFELTEKGSGTKLVFDHTGFPEGKGQHLAEGWRSNYWEPLEKYFAQGSS
ncbi:MAG TPA: SRPBCC family protein [Candidatus Acidoferrum sp.]|nr:SRPBCC family protein [Candidatus Acidoferrum sp.]